MSSSVRAPALLASMLWCVIGASWAAGSASPGGRWEGEARIPGAPLPLVLDLAPDASGAWRGSVILPGLGVKGAPLAAVSVEARAEEVDVQADLAGALG